VATQLGMMTLGVVDTIMVGHLRGGDALAAVALGNLFSWGAFVLGMGVLMALDPIAAQAWGRGDRAAVGAALARGLVLAGAVSVPYVVLFQFAEQILRALGQPPEVARVAGEFVRALVPGVPAFFAFLAVRQTLQAMSVVAPVLIAALIGNVANVAGNYALIYGRWGAPALGVPGSAWSTSICRWVMFAAIVMLGAPRLRGVWRARRDEASGGAAAASSSSSSSSSSSLLELAPYWRMLQIGIPTGIQMGLEMWAFNAAGLLVGLMGKLPLAAHQVALNLASLSFMVPVGIGQAAATRVGNAIGRGDADGARRAALAALGVGAAVMLVFAATYGLLPFELARAYTPDREIALLATPLIAIAGLFQIFDGTQAVGCGVLRGAADTRAAAIINFVGYWILGLPLGGALAFGARWGARGLWVGLTVGLAVVAVLLVARVWRRFVIR
jgi:MATE family, multidrug efflux pump